MTKLITTNCAVCNKEIVRSKYEIKRYKVSYCSKECTGSGKRGSKEEYSSRILKWYFEKGEVPMFKDFKYSSSVRKMFGNWAKALEYCGLNDLAEPTIHVYSNTPTRQKDRYRKLKIKYAKVLGGKCQVCGYSKCLAALQFHHRDPKDKDMGLDARVLGNVAESKILEELKKCDLVCANCHLELHNPELIGLI